MQTLINQQKCLFQECPREHHDAGGPVPNFIVLTLAEFHEKLTDLMLDFHLVHNRGPIIRHRDISVRGDQDLVHAPRSKTGPQQIRHGARGGDVGPLCLKSLHALAFLLLLDDDERSAVFVEGQELLVELPLHLHVGGHFSLWEWREFINRVWVKNELLGTAGPEFVLLSVELGLFEFEKGARDLEFQREAELGQHLGNFWEVVTERHDGGVHGV